MRWSTRRPSKRCTAHRQTGVQIDLIVRGVCALRPGIAGVSENIRVRSIVGRFLEHTRVFSFENGGEPELYCASADWMERNFFRRVEIAFPVRRASHRERILRELEIYLSDDTQAWILNAAGLYERAVKGSGVDAQAELIGMYATGASPVT